MRRWSCVRVWSGEVLCAPPCVLATVHAWTSTLPYPRRVASRHCCFVSIGLCNEGVLSCTVQADMRFESCASTLLEHACPTAVVLHVSSHTPC